MLYWKRKNETDKAVFLQSLMLKSRFFHLKFPHLPQLPIIALFPFLPSHPPPTISNYVYSLRALFATLFSELYKVFGKNLKFLSNPGCTVILIIITITTEGLSLAPVITKNWTEIGSVTKTEIQNHIKSTCLHFFKTHNVCFSITF